MKNMKKLGQREFAVTSEGEPTEVMYQYRPYRMVDIGQEVKDLLVGVDVHTGEILTIPPQSLLRLQKARRTKEKTLQARLSPEYYEYLDVISQLLGAPHPDKFGHAVVRFYLSEAQRNENLSHRLMQLGQQKNRIKTKTAVFKVLVDLSVWDWISQTTKQAGHLTQTDLVRGAIEAAKEDILDRPSKRRREQLAAVAIAV